MSLLFSYIAPLTAFAEGEETPPPEEQTTEQTTEETPPAEDPIAEEDAVVVTGDAVAESDVQNEVNTNEVNTEPEEIPAVEEGDGDTNEEQATENDTGGEEEPVVENSEENNSEEDVPLVNADVDNNNDAVVANTTDTEADTGDNDAVSGDEGDAIVATGDAVAVQNVVNVVNTNIFNSEGLFLFLSNLFAGFGIDLDLRDLGFFTVSSGGSQTNTRESAESCDGTCGDLNNVNIDNDNDASITNDVVVRANTGGNNAQGGSSSLVMSGDAYAAANVINIANTNIIDSNYLLMTFNNFGDFGGDVVFPAADAFMELFGNGNGTPSALTVNNNNTASIQNNVSVGADTGGNTATGTDGGNADVVTGNASAGGTVVNEINSNGIGGSAFQILFRIHGNWSGSINGTEPEGLTWRETGDGVELLFDGPGGLGPNINNLGLSNNNNATITNNIGVYALTGDNKAEGGDAAVVTGDAYSSANLINVANTNVVGRNWFLAIINIFGDWSGNISFGRPDLMVLSSVDTFTTGKVSAGKTVMYKFTVVNNGDTDAHNVKLRNLFDGAKLGYPAYKSYVKMDGNKMGTMTMDLGTIPAGGYQTVTYPAVVSQDIPLGASFIENTVEVTEDETDDNPLDNTDIISFEAWHEGVTYLYGNKIVYTPSPRLTVTKTNSTDGKLTQASSTVTYNLVIENSGGGSAYNAVLVDTLTDESGNVVYEEEWDLDEIHSGEQITINYDTVFNRYTPSGKYTNTAVVHALGGHPTFKYGRDATSNEAKSVVTIQGIPEPPVIEENEPEPQPTGVIDESFKAKQLLGVVEVIARELRAARARLALLQNGEAPLYDHPEFTQHPVYYIADDGPVYSHPQFTKQPVIVPQTVFGDEIFNDVASFGILKFLMLPWNTFSFGIIPRKAHADSANPPVEASGEDQQVLAFLALSMFILRKPRRKSKGLS